MKLLVAKSWVAVDVLAASFVAQAGATQSAARPGYHARERDRVPEGDDWFDCPVLGLSGRKGPDISRLARDFGQVRPCGTPRIMIVTRTEAGLLMIDFDFHVPIPSGHDVLLVEQTNPTAGFFQASQARCAVDRTARLVYADYSYWDFLRRRPAPRILRMSPTSANPGNR